MNLRRNKRYLFVAVTLLLFAQLYWNWNDGDVNKPTIYVITPTYTRPVQKAELTRLSHTLMLVPNLHWVIVEDSEQKTNLVAKLLAKTGMPYTHLNAATPEKWMLGTKEPRNNVKDSNQTTNLAANNLLAKTRIPDTDAHLNLSTSAKRKLNKKQSRGKDVPTPKRKRGKSRPHRGVTQRNTGLEWLRANVGPEEEGVVYFADDDNTYSLELFEEMRYIKKVGVWPVGLVGGLMVERPRLNRSGIIVGWRTGWGGKRKFAVDMAGFALNLKLFMSKPEAKFSYKAKKGYLESDFLEIFVSSLDQLEPLAEYCRKVYVWHTRTENPPLMYEAGRKKARMSPSNLGIEV